MTALLVLLTGHFVGDFVCQSDAMATQKSKSWRWLFYHVAVYSAVVALAALLMGIHPRLVWHFWSLTFVLHFLTDAVTSRITSRLWFYRLRWMTDVPSTEPVGPRTFPCYAVEDLGTRHWFFVAIGFDQLLHVYALAWAWSVAVR